MKAVVARGIDRYGIEDLELDPPKAREVRVRLKAASVCRFDLALIDGTIPTPYPVVLGHEGAGIVEEIGEGVTRVSPGDHVIFVLQGSCGRCRSCMQGSFVTCSTYPPEHMLAATLPEGTLRHHRANGEGVYAQAGLACLAEQAIAHEDYVVKIDSTVSFDRACIVACSVMAGAGCAIFGGDIRRGDAVAILGCGPVGLAAVQGARIAGAAQIVAVDLVANKLALARDLGATHLVDGSTASVIERIRTIAPGGVDVAFECAGVHALTIQAYASLCNGGRLVLIGIPRVEAPLDIPAFSLPFSGRTVRGGRYGSHHPQLDVPALLDYHQRGLLDLDVLVGGVRPFEQVGRVLDDLRRQPSARVVILFD